MAYPSAQMASQPVPTESITHVLEQAQEQLGALENKMDELTARLLNFPRAISTQGLEKAPHISSINERVMELRSRAIRINESLTTILDKL